MSNSKRPLKVYGWMGFLSGGQVRAIVAAPSKVAAARAVHPDRKPQQLFNLSETGNKEEIEAATAQPGVVLVRPLDARNEPYVPVPDGQRL